MSPMLGAVIRHQMAVMSGRTAEKRPSYLKQIKKGVNYERGNNVYFED
jgi:hypothetical protein